MIRSFPHGGLLCKIKDTSQFYVTEFAVQKCCTKMLYKDFPHVILIATQKGGRMSPSACHLKKCSKLLLQSLRQYSEFFQMQFSSNSAFQCPQVYLWSLSKDMISYCQCLIIVGPSVFPHLGDK